MLSIAQVKTEAHDHYVHVCVFLENEGTSVVRPGTMFGRQTSLEGAVRVVEFLNSTNIAPGCTAKVSQLVTAMTKLEFTGYRQSDGVIIPFSGGIVKRHSFLPSVAVVIRRWWDQVLGPRSKSLAPRFKILYGNAQSRLAEVYKREKLRAQTARSALGSFNAETVRWQNEVLLPRSKSIAAHLKLLYGNAQLRLAQIYEKPRAQVVRSALRSGYAEIARWWDEVLRPHTESVIARFKALQENGRLRLWEAKQRRKLQADVEREAWQSVDADILRWWNEVLLPRSRSIVTRLKAMLGRHKGSE